MFILQCQATTIVEISMKGKVLKRGLLKLLSDSTSFPLYTLCVVISNRGISVGQKEHTFQAFWINSAKTRVLYFCLDF